MSAEVQSQFYLFFLAVFWGIGMCLAYDGLRILRNLIRHSLFWINAEDLLYWAVMTAVLFYLLFTYNRGGDPKLHDCGDLDRKPVLSENNKSCIYFAAQPGAESLFPPVSKNPADSSEVPTEFR